jgi:nucleotide-binding universal stress UspA family protein
MSAVDVVDAVADRVWPLGSETRLVVVRKISPRDPMKDSEITLMAEQAAQKLRSNGLKVSIAIRDSTSPEVLLHEAREFAADSIFVGLRHEVNDGGNGLGLVKAAEALVLGAHCSVELVRGKNLGNQYFKPAA